MLKEYSRVLTRMMMVADLCLVAVVFFLAYYTLPDVNNKYTLRAFMAFLPLILIIWGVLLRFFDMYTSLRTKGLFEILPIIVQTAFVAFVVFGSFIYSFRLEYVSRLFIAFIFALAAVFLLIEKFAMRLFFAFIRSKGYNFRNILVIGTGKRAQHFLNLVAKHNEWGLRVVGLVEPGPVGRDEAPSGYRILGSLKDIPDIIHNNVVDEIVFIVPRSMLDTIETAMRFCELEGLKVNVAVDYFELKFAKAKQTDLDGFPMLTFETTPDMPWHLLLKRFLDILISGIAIIALSPVLVILAVLVKMSSKGGVFFRQERVGLNGRHFMLYKFRTMVMGAESKLNDLMAYNEMNGPVFKLANDPRVTQVGKFLRKFSMDELPQLWNVLRGDMSLVGPRPPLRSEVEKYDSWQRRRLSMRPGITCLWQVSGRNKIKDFNEWAKLDLDYIDKWSLGLDLKIMAKTVPAVILGIGAK